jgi:hypothetical protein
MFRLFDNIDSHLQVFDELQEMIAKAINKLRSGIKKNYGF